MKQDYAACIDTYCQGFSNGEMEIKTSYGTAYELTPNTGYVAKYQPEYQELKTEIDGRKAEMSTHYDDAYIFKYITWVHFPDVGDGKTHLSIKAVCNEQHDLEMARQAFSTVEFP